MGAVGTPGKVGRATHATRNKQQNNNKNNAVDIDVGMKFVIICELATTVLGTVLVTGCNGYRRSVH